MVLNKQTKRLNLKKMKKKIQKKSNPKSISKKKSIPKISSHVKSQNAFHSANYRRRKKGLPELSYEQYCKQSVSLDSSGRFHPRKHNAYQQAVAIFGKEILSKKKNCLKCKKKKLLSEFSMRYQQKIILNVCKECEQERQRKYWKT